MKENELYIKIEQNVLVTNKKVFLEDIAKLYSVNKKMVKELGKEVVTVFKGDKNTKHMFSILKIIELIHKSHPQITVINLGEKDFILEYKTTTKTNKPMEYLKAAVVSLTVFFGSAFTIMTFNTDVSVSDIFDKIYELVMGQQKTGGSILEFMYCIGLPIGILVFYNHFSRWKLHNDPTPIQVEMRKYEEEINKALIQDASREGKTIDAD